MTYLFRGTYNGNDYPCNLIIIVLVEDVILEDDDVLEPHAHIPNAIMVCVPIGR